MTFCFIELQTINNERLNSYPLSYRVIKAKVQLINYQQIDGQLPMATIQKLRPIVSLSPDELKFLKINDKILEKYPLVSDYLITIGQDPQTIGPRCIFIPASEEAQEILIELSKQPENPFYHQPVLAITPGIIQMVTGLCFEKSSSIPHIIQVLQEIQQQNQNNIEEDFMADAQQFEFADCLEQPQEIFVNNNNLLDNKDNISTDFNIETLLELVRLMLKHYKQDFIDCVQKFTEHTLNLQELYNQQTEVLRLDATQLLTWKIVEQMGLKTQEVFDIRHVIPGTTLIKFYTKTSIQEKLQVAQQFFNNKQKVRFGGREIALTAKPSIVNQFPPNPTFVYINNVQDSKFKQDFLNLQIQQFYRMKQQQDIKKAYEKIYVFKNSMFEQINQNGQENIRVQFQQDLNILCFLYPGMDHESNKRLQQLIMDNNINDYEWGLISEIQVKSLIQQKCQNINLLDSALQNQYQAQSFRSVLSMQPSSQTLQQEPEFSSKPIINPHSYVPEFAKNQPNSMRQQRQNASCIQILDLPFDVKVKDVAGFCKSMKIAESMCWNLHQPFNNAMGPIKIYPNYVLLIFISRDAAQRAERILQTSVFKGQRITVKISEEQQDMLHLNQCYEIKDLPFSPCYVVILKQIKLPPTPQEFGDVIENVWRLPRPDSCKVYQDNGICFYKNSSYADTFYLQMKNEFFKTHINDIFRMDYD